ncbi:unnamed protein product, partial [marine sediment metagenome]
NKMEDLSKALPLYLEILEKKRKPKFKLHKNLLNKKIKDSFEILKKCELCERKCGVNRFKALGWCKVRESKLSSYFEHIGEEYFFIPSFTIFFISCNFSCQYCQNWTISQRIEKGTKISEKKLAKIIDRHSNCKNVNFVGGEPTPNLPFILKTLNFVKSDIPMVWNSNFYMSEKSMDLLSNIVDVYLSDFKYGNDKCALRLSKVPNYFEIIKRNHLLAFKDSELVIRHLVLPNHFDCCTKPILDFIAENFKDKVIVNIMDQYTSQFKASE